MEKEAQAQENELQFVDSPGLCVNPREMDGHSERQTTGFCLCQRSVTISYSGVCVSFNLIEFLAVAAVGRLNGGRLAK